MFPLMSGFYFHSFFTFCRYKNYDPIISSCAFYITPAEFNLPKPRAVTSKPTVVLFLNFLSLLSEGNQIRLKANNCSTSWILSAKSHFLSNIFIYNQVEYSWENSHHSSDQVVLLSVVPMEILWKLTLMRKKIISHHDSLILPRLWKLNISILPIWKWYGRRVELHW